jgi:hypothetical protein
MLKGKGGNSTTWILALETSRRAIGQNVTRQQGYKKIADPD